jgi:cytochrome c oxidase subunit 2
VAQTGRQTAVDILAAVIGAVRTLGSIAGLGALAFILSSCDFYGLSPIFPDPVSPNGAHIYETYAYISIPAIIVFIGVEAALLWVAIRYRRSRQPAGYVPPQMHGHTGLEIAWTIAPLVIVLGIAGYSFAQLQRDFQPISNQDMTVVISAHQFGWDYDYGNGVVVHQ